MQPIDPGIEHIETGRALEQRNAHGMRGGTSGQVQASDIMRV